MVALYLYSSTRLHGVVLNSLSTGITLLLPVTVGIGERRVLYLGYFFILWSYIPNLGLRLSPWNSPFHFDFLDLRQSIGLLGWVTSSSQGLCLYTNTESQHKHQTSMPWVGFEPTIAASERAKTVHGSDRSASVTGFWDTNYTNLITIFSKLRMNDHCFYTFGNPSHRGRTGRKGYCLRVR
jgi:hypothetical protein